MELWDLYDADRQPLGKTFERGKEMHPGQLHIVVHICVFNEKNEMLIQHRQPFKDGWPNRWDLSAGGSALCGETSRPAAQRETAEEIGIQYDFADERPFLTIHFDCGFDDYYIIHPHVVDPASLVLQESEVQAVRWASCDEVLRMIDNEEFIPYRKNLIKLLFDFAKEEALPAKNNLQA